MPYIAGLYCRGDVKFIHLHTCSFFVVANESRLMRKQVRLTR